jgi:hypothetical protein
MRPLLLTLGLLLFFAAEFLRIYFIMPFPGSQHRDTIALAYFIGRHIWAIRIAALLLVIYGCQKMTRGKAILVSVLAVLYAVIFFYFNFRFQADKMFRQPQNLSLVDAMMNKIDSNSLVIGVALNGESGAYPIRLIGYHHQIRDSIGGVPVMVTYCTVCRTGRVYSPEVGGKPESFRLVGMDHFNAMFEDSRTKSWWQQATGVAVAGPLKGEALKEIPSSQSTLRNWLRDHPTSRIMQPDTIFSKQYDKGTYDKGLTPGSLEKRDSSSWAFKSWVVGVKTEKGEKAYDWNRLVQERTINDAVGGYPVLLALEPDSTTFHAWRRGDLFFQQQGAQLLDTNTRSVWNLQGVCVSGPMAGKRLQALPAYQEFWHSWKQFHPGTAR